MRRLSRTPSRPRSLGSFAALLTLFTLGGAPVLSAQTTLTPGEWNTFSWFDGNGSWVDPSFSYSSVNPFVLQVTDGYYAGDVFSVFVNGDLTSPLFTTSAVAAGGSDSGAMDGATAWTTTGLSKGQYRFDPGTYRLDLQVVQDGGFGYGDAFIRAADAPSTSVAPEPVSLVLLGTGLAGIGAMRRRRMRGRSVRST